MVLPIEKKSEYRTELINEHTHDAEEKERQIVENQTEPQVAPQPVAYDANGNPLYAAPPQSANTPQPQVVHVARSTEPVAVEISDEVRKKHDESVKRFPWLNLSDHEYVISAVRRHSVGMWAPLIVTTIAVALVFTIMLLYPEIAAAYDLPMSSYVWVIVTGLAFTAAFIFGGYLAMWVYMNNRFFLTNESVIQEIQSSIFSKREQTVSLMNIEDASYTQRGPVQQLLNYGSIRLSTEGDETTYRFDYVSNPKEEIATLNNAVEAFKNGRPVELVGNEQG